MRQRHTFIVLASAIIAVCVGVPSYPARSLDLNPLAAIKNAIHTAIEDRNAADISRDIELGNRILSEVIEPLGSEFLSIHSDVYEQTVMLTGVTDQIRQKQAITRQIEKMDGVKGVFNDLIVVPAKSGNESAAEDFVDDTVIESKINAQLFAADTINVTNFRWRSVRSHVFLLGRALSEPEHKKVLGIVGNINKVQSVTDHIFIRSRSGTVRP